MMGSTSSSTKRRTLSRTARSSSVRAASMLKRSPGRGVISGEARSEAVTSASSSVSMLVAMSGVRVRTPAR
jgi:hypothetical protein